MPPRRTKRKIADNVKVNKQEAAVAQSHNSGKEGEECQDKNNKG